MPNIADRMRALTTWLDKLPPAERDRVLLDESAVRALDARYAALEDGPKDLLDPALASEAASRKQIAGAIAFVRAQHKDGKTVIADADLDRAEARSIAMEPARELHALSSSAFLLCIPTDAPILTPGGTVAYDRNRCSDAHAGDLVLVMGRSKDGYVYARTSYAVGWMKGESMLGPRLDDAGARAHRDAHPSALPFTRHNVLSSAFVHLGDRYGWGGYEGGVDCSRFTLDLFDTFGIALPRNSKTQAEAGSRTVSVAALDAKGRLAALRDANTCGVVLAQMPGHIMLYLGEDAEPGDGSGTYVLSALGDVREPCAGGGETILRVEHVDVMPLSIGAGTSKGSILSRLERLTVLGECR